MGTGRPRGDGVQPTAPEPAAGELCRGVSWSDRDPYLELIDDDSRLRLLPLYGRRLGLRTVAPGPYCLGYSGDVGGVLTLVRCPRHNLATSGQQCEECVAKDEFRFAHHAHLGGYVPNALAAYLKQPHWVYVATFADATSKVGTASDGRQAARIDEQGAAMATYVARVPDGRVARRIEDAVTERTGLAQVKRRSAKVAALVRPAATEAVQAEHRDAVGPAREVVRSSADPAGVDPAEAVWTRPTATHGFFADVPTGGWLPYPHDLRSGDHGFHVDAIAGATLLARLRDEVDSARYVVDLGAVVGCRIAVGPYSSPNTPVQMSLF
jgi:Protein of unknown function (DUF2797)